MYVFHGRPGPSAPAPPAAAADGGASGAGGAEAVAHGESHGKWATHLFERVRK